MQSGHSAATVEKVKEEKLMPECIRKSIFLQVSDNTDYPVSTHWVLAESKASAKTTRMNGAQKLQIPFTLLP